MLPLQLALFAEAPAKPNHVVDWQSLLERIQRLDRSADEEFYFRVHRGIRAVLIGRGIAPDSVDDIVHDVYIIAVDSIRSGKIRNADALPSFIRTVTLRKAFNEIGEYVKQRANGDPEHHFERLAARDWSPENDTDNCELRAIAAEAFRRLRPRDREILERFYLREENKEQICDALGLTETQFRLGKSRAKSRFEAILIKLNSIRTNRPRPQRQGKIFHSLRAMAS